MDQARDAARPTRVVVIVAIVALLAAAVGALAFHRPSKAPRPAAAAPVAQTVPPTTLVYGARPGPNGTKLLTEPVDPLTLAVPGPWITPAPDQSTLPDEITRLAAAAPILAGLLQGVRQQAVNGAMRLFAYQPTAPPEYVWVISLSSPNAGPLTASEVGAQIAATKQRAPNPVVSGVQLPAGPAVKVDSTLVVQKQRVAIEDLYLRAAGRTVLVELVGVTTGTGSPAVFAQVAQSLRLS